METIRIKVFLCYVLAVCFITSVLGQGTPAERYNVTAPTGSRLRMRCQSKQLAVGRTRVGDLQRVVHWDLLRGPPDHGVERILDMFPSGEQRVYNSFNKGRVNMSKNAFVDGNFSLVIRGVGMNDRGVYTCHLHHHYCNLNESIKVQLNVTKTPRKVRHFWDGEKAVFVVLLDSTVILPCVNRRPLWTRRQQEVERQVVRWDWRAAWAHPNSAEDLVSMFASVDVAPKQGSLFQPDRMSIPPEAFVYGDFSLTIIELQPPDGGVYTCHLSHQYCGLRKRISFQVNVGPSLPPELTAYPRHEEEKSPGPSAVDMPTVNIIVSKHGSYLYVLAILLTVALVAVVFVVLLTCQFKKRGLDYHLRRMEQSYRASNAYCTNSSTVELKMCNQTDNRAEYKNNIWKEKADMSKLPSPKVIDLDTEMSRTTWN